MRRYILIIIALALAACSSASLEAPRPETTTSRQEVRAASAEDRVLVQAFDERKRHFQVRGQGRVQKLLPDDDEGSRHQRFVVQLESGQTLLIAHNIDLAPRVSSLREGDTIAFNGEYEFNPEGGVIHWTHHDPLGRHPAGWLKHNGKIYQ